MSFSELDWLSVLLRAMIYTGSIAVAGSALMRATLNTDHVAGTVNWQIVLGSALLLVCEPLRYVMFQLAIAQGDCATAFAPELRWMGVETPLGQAASMRLIAVIVVLIGFLWHPFAIVGALAMISSFLLEGHTVSHGERPLLAVLLFVHLAIAHWWLAALLPLRACIVAPETVADHNTAADLVDEFGRKAVVGVAALLIAGLIMLGLLTGRQLDISSPYKQGFAIKVAFFAAILSIAAINKMRWTPMLTSAPEIGRRGLRMSISIEIGVAVVILIATAIATSFPTDG